jgi:hypothetical protein
VTLGPGSGSGGATGGAAAPRPASPASASKPTAAPALPAAAPEPVEEPKSPAPAAPEEPKKFPVLPWAITGVLAAGTVVTGILASGAHSDYEETKETFPISRAQLDDAQAKARDLWLLSGALGVGTVVSLAVSSYVTFFATSSSSGPPGSKARVGLLATPFGVSLEGVMP